MRLSLSLSSPTAAPKLVSQWTSECVSKWGASLFIYTRLAHVGVSFHWQGRLLLLCGYNHLYYIPGPLWYILGPTSLSTYYNYIMTNPQKGIWSFPVSDMINPQWGLIQWIIYQIIIRIHFAVTLFQHSPLTRRVFFNSIRREREDNIINNIKWVRGQHHQYHLGTLTGVSINHRKFSSSTESSFSKECNHHLHQYELV